MPGNRLEGSSALGRNPDPTSRALNLTSPQAAPRGGRGRGPARSVLGSRPPPSPADGRAGPSPRGQPGPGQGSPPPPPHCRKAPGAAWSGERLRPPAPLCPSPSLSLPWDSRLGGDTGASFVLVICVPRVRPVFRPPGLRQLNTIPDGSQLSRLEAQGGGGVGGARPRDPGDSVLSAPAAPGRPLQALGSGGLAPASASATTWPPLCRLPASAASRDICLWVQGPPESARVTAS